MAKDGFLVLSWILVAVVAIGSVAFGVDGALVATLALGGSVLLAGAATIYSSRRGVSSLMRPKLATATAETEAPEADETSLGWRSPRISRIIGVSLAIHLVSAVVVNLTDLNRAVAPDTYQYRYCGVFLAKNWSDPSYDAGRSEDKRSKICPSYKPHRVYQKMNGVIEYLVGSEKFTHVFFGIMNSFIGLYAAWVMAQVARFLYGGYAEEKALQYIAFFPSLIVWRSVNLRESWSFLLFSGAILAGMKLRERFNMRDLAAFALCVGMMPFIRGYMVGLIAAGTLLSYLAVRVRQVPTAILTGVVLFFVVRALTVRLGVETEDIDVETSLAVANDMHRGLAGGGSSFAADVDISTPAKALAYLPKGLAMFLFAPFPWSLASWRQVAALPESFTWYWLLFAGTRQLIRSARTALVRIALPLSVIIVVCLAYGLVEGNAGTAYRHRAHVMLLMLVFAGGDAAFRRGRNIETSEEPRLAPSSA